MGDPVVVCRNDDHATGSGQVAQQDEDALHLDVVEMRRRLVGDHQGRLVGERTGDGHALLLTARHLSRAVGDPSAE